MQESQKFVIHEIDSVNLNYYTGRTYMVQGGVYPVVTNDINKAKIYTSKGRVDRGLKTLEEKCIHNTFEVLPIDVSNIQNKNTSIETELFSNHEFSLGEKLQFVNGLAKKDPILNFLINLENGGLGNMTITEALDALAGGSIDLPGRKRSLIIEENKK